MAKDKYTMPMSTAGLVRYFEESEKAIKIKPQHVIGVAVAIAVVEIAVRFIFGV